jgi:thioredoxin 1
MAQSVIAQNFDKEVVQSKLPVVVDVFATWCGPCKMMTPLFEELSKEMGDRYKFVKINIDEERDIAIQYNVSSIPTLLFIKDGKLVAKETGYMNKESLKAKIEAHLK